MPYPEYVIQQYISSITGFDANASRVPEIHDCFSLEDRRIDEQG